MNYLCDCKYRFFQYKDLQENKIYSIIKLCVSLYFPYFFFILFFVGCADNIKSQNLQKDSKQKEYLYGIGYGASFQEAKQYAIKDLSTNLQVSIKFVAKDVVRQKDNSLQTSGIAEVSLESAIKDLPALEIEKQTKKDNKFSVRVRVEKSLLQSQILNRIQANQQTLDSLLETCNTPPFHKYKDFKQILEDYKNDLAIYQILSKNMSYNSALTIHYQDISNSLPNYNIKLEFQHDNPNNIKVQRTLYSELGKFIKIDSSATKTLEILIENADITMVYLSFYDCNKKLENVVKINTYLPYNTFYQAQQITRFGAIVYKNIEATN
ncbi:hypothetical protein CQA53_00855 [Helicobacter didelphidarum]|uniref:LPP20 lipofamily protein n=1 Tax=Helicobacter didelphidarum TaxID=2040648 RepID=A0A3D8IRI6_9HELI|nr:LPP20 family lipoprotein [Helicobacter didelphidarum]RDU67590.1 hypothetical protein CQA53_00855 [Helicobacter didelphidarum]